MRAMLHFSVDSAMQVFQFSWEEAWNRMLNWNIGSFFSHEYKPKAVFSENVPTLLSRRHKAFGEFIVKEIERAGYEVQVRILNTKDFHIPQNRKRWYLQAVRNDVLRHNAPIVWWPTPCGPPIAIKHMIKILPPDEWKSVPDQILHRENVMSA